MPAKAIRMLQATSCVKKSLLPLKETNKNLEENTVNLTSSGSIQASCTNTLQSLSISVMAIYIVCLHTHACEGEREKMYVFLVLCYLFLRSLPDTLLRNELPQEMLK